MITSNRSINYVKIQSYLIIIMSIEKKISNSLQSTIVYLNLTGLEDDHLYKIAESDTNNKIELWMANNKITFVGIYELSLSSWNSLLRLGLWNNKLGSKGCKFLSRMACPSLQYLNLSNNEIETTGVAHLTKLNSTKLFNVDLSNNMLGFSSALKLTKGNWKELKDIFMNGNRLRNEDILDLLLLDIPYGSKVGAEVMEKGRTMKNNWERKFGYDNFF